MGTVTEPVSGSASCPAWIAVVAKPKGLFLVVMVFDREQWFDCLELKNGAKKLDAAFEDVFGHVTLGAIGTHGHDALPRSKSFCDLQSGSDVRPAAGTGKHAFVARQFANHGERRVVVDHHDLVGIFPIKGFLDETDSDAL